MSTEATFDAGAVMAEIRAEVERRQAAGDYDEVLLQAIHEEFNVDTSEPPEATAYIAVVRPIASTRPLIGPIVAFAKRVIRRLIAWYVAPVAEDQTRHNVAVIHLVRSLERRLTAVDHALSPVAPRGRGDTATTEAAAVDDLRLRVLELEQQVAALTATAAAAQPASSSDSE